MTNDLFRNPFRETGSFSVAVVRLANRCVPRDSGTGHNLVTNRHRNDRASKPAMRFSCQSVFWLKSPDSADDTCHFGDAVCKSYNESPATIGDFTPRVCLQTRCTTFLRWPQLISDTGKTWHSCSIVERYPFSRASCSPTVLFFSQSSCPDIPLVPTWSSKQVSRFRPG
ncbi:MAG: hypothetical protein RIS70_1490 [Planctomycetota bacterium]